MNQRREEPQQVPIQVAGEATVRAHENETQRMLREIASLKASLASESNRAAIINECNLKLGEEIRKRSKFTSLRYHRLDDMIEAIGLDKCKLCTYCWDGNED